MQVGKAQTITGLLAIHQPARRAKAGQYILTVFSQQRLQPPGEIAQAARGGQRQTRAGGLPALAPAPIAGHQSGNDIEPGRRRMQSNPQRGADVALQEVGEDDALGV